MSHSLACNLHMWDPQMAALTGKFKVLRFDTRGHGQSSAPAGEYTLEQLADDVKGLLDALKIKQTHWVGLSMGGMIGQAFALKYPGVFQSMVLADTTSRRPPNAGQMWSERIAIAREKGHGCAGRQHARALVHRAVPQLAQGRDGAHRRRTSARPRSPASPAAAMPSRKWTTSTG